MFAKLIKHKMVIFVAGGIILVATSLAVLSPGVNDLLTGVMASYFPDLGRIYRAEQAAFPNYTIGVTKNVESQSSFSGQSSTTTSYDVELTSSSMPPSSDVARARQVACETGLGSGTPVDVTARRQYYFLAIYESNTTGGTCP